MKKIILSVISAIFLTVVFSCNGTSTAPVQPVKVEIIEKKQEDDKPDICDCVQEQKAEEGKMNHKLARKCMQTYTGEELAKADCNW